MRTSARAYGKCWILCWVDIELETRPDAPLFSPAHVRYYLYRRFPTAASCTVEKIISTTWLLLRWCEQAVYRDSVHAEFGASDYGYDVWSLFLLVLPFCDFVTFVIVSPNSLLSFFLVRFFFFFFFLKKKKKNNFFFCCAVHSWV